MNRPVGFVYFVRNTRSRAVKVGWSEKPAVRLGGLQVGCEDALALEATLPGTKKDEGVLHRALAAEHVHGEWFRGPAVDAMVANLSRVAS